MDDEELFKIDIDVDEDREEIKKPDYDVDHFMIGGSKDDGLIEDDQGKRISTGGSSDKCWNCDGIGHSLRDCPVALNRIKINQAKKNFMKTQTGSKRYHDNKFSKFRPGHHSSELREALGLRSDEIPMHIYMMRVLGYPPGWLAESKITNSGIKMYNDRGKRIPEPGEEDGEILNKMMKYDIDKLIEYPGFNAPLDRNVYDESRSLGFPPMKSEHKLKNFIKKLEEMSKKEEDMDDSTDDEPVDMEISEMLPSQIIEEVKNINKRILEINNKKSSPNVAGCSIGNKKRSLDKDKKSNSDDESNSKRRRSNDNENGQETQNVEEDKNENIDEELEEGEIEENEEITKSDENSNSSNDNNTDITPDSSFILKRSLPININKLSAEDSSRSTPSPRGSVTGTSFGTPNLKSHSPYSKLPSFGNFNKDISDVIDFENLPDSVGKYDSMCSIITKIRSYMTSSKSSKSDDGSPKCK